MDHPLLVLGKGSNEESETDLLLDAETGDQAGTVKQMIAEYAGAKEDKDGGSEQDGAEDSAYKANVLKGLAEKERETECFICTGEIFDEVLLPCYHTG